MRWTGKRSSLPATSTAGCATGRITNDMSGLLPRGSVAAAQGGKEHLLHEDRASGEAVHGAPGPQRLAGPGRSRGLRERVAAGQLQVFERLASHVRGGA